MSGLVVNFCDHKAAKFATSHWHYSKSMPTPPIVKIGVWENGDCKRVVLFGKHRYLMPLDKKMRRQLKSLAQPYPKQDTRTADGSPLATSEGTAVQLRPVRSTNDMGLDPRMVE